MAQQDQAGDQAGDWVTQVIGLLDRFVGGLSNKATRPLVKVVRGLVYGALAGVLAVMALILVAIAAVRVLVIVTGAIFSHEQPWLAEVAVGLVFLLAGLFILSKRHAGADAG